MSDLDTPFLLQIQNTFYGFVADLLELIVRQAQLQKALRFLHRIPQRIIRTESHALRAVDVDVLLRDAVFHEHHGTGNIENTILLDTLNAWLKTYKETPAFKQLMKKYSTN